MRANSSKSSLPSPSWSKPEKTSSACFPLARPAFLSTSRSSLLLIVPELSVSTALKAARYWSYCDKVCFCSRVRSDGSEAEVTCLCVWKAMDGRAVRVSRVEGVVGVHWLLSACVRACVHVAPSLSHTFAGTRSNFSGGGGSSFVSVLRIAASGMVPCLPGSTRSSNALSSRFWMTCLWSLGT